MGKKKTLGQSGNPEPEDSSPGTTSGYPEPWADIPLPPYSFSQFGGPPGTLSMPVPPPLNCPPGLEHLILIDQLLVQQQVEILEGQEIIILKRPLRCNSCFFPCCLQKIEVQAPPGVPIGYVSQTWHPCFPKFSVQNENRKEVLKVIGPIMVCNCSANIDFEVKSLDKGTVVGKISKQWAGFIKELFTNSDNFGIQFPLDLDVKMKAVMLGACFLIDFMFFENTGLQRPKIGIW
ncbi:phospholipid scramblase 1 isoform X2 [Marmota monax]|uniref:phospholipid scramblase 1 isoform X2 n=1 Tax=Marmota monax TaxID=9995 RepID=UPI001EAFA33F|nr:phospholipid scramblase 1 isoform X2 [Marmota monax]XP_048650129.1 phospholipid scramblase 1-like isoform X2 [Marmota marmota marmota]